MKESLADTKKWREEQEKNIKYFNNISNMTLPNDSNLPSIIMAYYYLFC